MNVTFKNWVLVFIFMYLVLVDAMDWSKVSVSVSENKGLALASIPKLGFSHAVLNILG